MVEERNRQALLAVLGVSAGVAAGLWLWRRWSGGTRYAPTGSWPPGLAQEIAASLRQDPDLRRRAIDVDAIAEGVIELSGSVRTREEAERAVGLAQASGGVHTVVNRLLVQEDEEQIRENLRRRANGAPEFRNRRHSGMGVGMGSRRQSAATDPDRPSDKQEILDRELDVGTVEDAAAEAPAAPMPEEPVDPVEEEEADGDDPSSGPERS
ncbi:MAG: BON domain-containing protein [Gemmatimonadota bacterium]|jgi:hypothetical protein